MASIEMKGMLSVSGGCGPCGGASGDQTVRRLALRCGGFSPYETIAETPSPLRVSTPGALGAAFVPLDIADGFTAIEFLYVVTDSALTLRISDGPPEVEGIQLALPTGYVGGETMVFTIDETPVTVVFTAGDQTLADVVNRINAACAAAALATPRAVATGINTFKIVGVATRFESNSTLTAFRGLVNVTTTPAGMVASAPLALANGNDVTVFGTMLVELRQYPNAPTKVEVSGIGAIRAMVAGRTSP